MFNTEEEEKRKKKKRSAETFTTRGLRHPPALLLSILQRLFLKDNQSRVNTNILGTDAPLHQGGPALLTS